MPEYKIAMREVKPQLIAVARGTAAPSEIAKVMLPLIGVAWNFTRAAGIKAGRNVAVYDGRVPVGIEAGAEVLVGGEGHPEGFEAGYFVKPTVFVNVKNDMTIAQEEIFGPVLCVIAYDSEDEAIRIANDSKYGLHAAVLGTDLPRAHRVASQIRAGRIVINNMTDDPQAPWGGFKYSGVGREYGRYGIEAFLETRAILDS